MWQKSSRRALINLAPPPSRDTLTPPSVDMTAKNNLSAVRRDRPLPSSPIFRFFGSAPLLWHEPPRLVFVVWSQLNCQVERGRWREGAKSDGKEKRKRRVLCANKGGAHFHVVVKKEGELWGAFSLHFTGNNGEKSKISFLVPL